MGEAFSTCKTTENQLVAIFLVGIAVDAQIISIIHCREIDPKKGAKEIENTYHSSLLQEVGRDITK